MPSSKDIVYPSITPADQGATLWTDEVCQRLEDEFQATQESWEKLNLGERSLHCPGYRYLYKYRSVDPKHPERTEKVLFERTLWAASLIKLNDPLEAAFAIAENMSNSKVAEVMNSVVHGNWWGCVCLSADPVCVQMWAHYSAEHSGFCIQYRRADSFLLSTKNCQPLYYTHSPPAVGVPNDRIHEVFWTKSDVWEYEREWRLMYPRSDAYLRPNLLIPCGIIFGLRTTNDTKRLLRKSATNVRFGQITPTNEFYRLKIVWED